MLATPEGSLRPGTIAHAIAQPDGAIVYIDGVSVAKLKGHQNPAYFVVREPWQFGDMIIVYAAPSDVLRLGYDVDIEGTLDTMPNGVRIIRNPRVIGYYSESGDLLRRCPYVKSLTTPPWQWKAELPPATDPNPAGQPVPGEPNLELPSPPIYHDTVASLLQNAVPGTSALLQCKKVSEGNDPVYGDFLIVEDDLSSSAVKVYCGTSSQPTMNELTVEADDTERVNNVSGQVQLVGTELALVLDEGPNFDTQGLPGGLQTVNGGTTSFAKSFADGSTATIQDVIVTDYDPLNGVGYVEDADCSSGIRIVCGGFGALEFGSVVTVAGSLQTNSGGEREFHLTSPAMNSSTDKITIAPLVMVNRSLGGSSFNNLTPGINYPTPGYGLNNKGLLVKIFGRVTAVDEPAGCFYLDDGSTSMDGGPVKVLWNVEGDASSIPTVGEFLTGVVGISSSEAVGPDQYARLLRLRYLARPVVTGMALSGFTALGWTPQDYASYRVYRGESESGPFDLVATVSGGTFSDIGLTNGKTYYYKVCAVDSFIAGDMSQVLALTPNEPPPTQISPPVTTIALEGTLGNNDWYVSLVTVTLSATDPDDDLANTYYQLDALDGSDWQTYADPFDVSADGTHTLLAYSDDTAGNAEYPPVEQTFKIDATAPEVIGAATTEPNANGWYNSEVEISYSAVDDLSGLEGLMVADPGVSIEFTKTVSTEGADLSDTGEATDKAGNVGSYTVGGLNIDTSAPTVTGAVASQPNANGWYNGDVQINYSAVDNISGLDSPEAADPGVSIQFTNTISVEGAGLSDTGQATDKAGNTGSSTISGLRIDKTPPSVTVISAPTGNCNLISYQMAVIRFSAVDGTSGITGLPWAVVNIIPTEGWAQPTSQTLTATSLGGGVYEVSFPFQVPGAYSVVLYAKDFAGNIGQTTSVLSFGAGGFQVDWLPPISLMETYIMQDGSTVPVKWRLIDPCNNNTYVNNYNYILKVVRTSDQTLMTTVTPSFDAVNGNYHANVKTKDANNVDWPLGDYTVIIEGPGIWDMISGPYRSRYGLQLVEKAVAKGVGRR